MTPDTTHTFLGQLSTQLVQIILPILASALVALVVMALKKLGISISADNQAKLDYTAKQAVLKMQEVAASKLQQGLERIPGAQKLELATADVLAKLPNVTQAEAVDAIHAALPQLGLGAAAGITALGKALQTPKVQ